MVNSIRVKDGITSINIVPTNRISVYYGNTCVNLVTIMVNRIRVYDGITCVNLVTIMVNRINCMMVLPGST